MRPDEAEFPSAAERGAHRVCLVVMLQVGKHLPVRCLDLVQGSRYMSHCMKRYRVDPSPDRAIQPDPTGPDSFVGASSHRPQPRTAHPSTTTHARGVMQLYQPPHQVTEAPGLPLLETAPDPPSQLAGREPGLQVRDWMANPSSLFLLFSPEDVLIKRRTSATWEGENADRDPR
jgi:hypothetical protein